MKTVGGFLRTRYRRLDRTGLAGYLAGTAYNLAPMAKLMTAETPAPRPRLAALPGAARTLLKSQPPRAGPSTRGQTARQRVTQRYCGHTSSPHIAKDGLNKSVDCSSTHWILSRADGLFRVSPRIPCCRPLLGGKDLQAHHCTPGDSASASVLIRGGQLHARTAMARLCAHRNESAAFEAKLGEAHARHA